MNESTLLPAENRGSSKKGLVEAAATANLIYLKHEYE